MIVVDASVVANVVADDEADGRTAREAVGVGEELAAPDLVDVETVSVLRRRWLTKDLPARRFRTAIDDLVQLPIVRYPTGPLMARAYELRGNVSPYDAAYVGLAEVLGCALLTADARLAAAPGLRCEVVVVRP